MGGKHKKFIRSEKAKVKLKGLKLPKGLNITKTQFKIKKIVIRTQLEEQSYESGKKKNNIKEVLPRLKHHNTSFRKEALKTLKNYLTHNSYEIHRSMGSIVHGIASLALDIEREVRLLSFKFLNDMLSQFNAKSLEPFFNIIASHLKCAMSHINQSIQEDSLVFLDVLIINLPKLIMQHHNQIFCSFLNMISKLKEDSKPGRVLTLNLGNKTTTIKWRTKILDRLHKILDIILDHWKIESSKISNTLHKSKTIMSKDHSPYFYLYDSINITNNVDFSNIFCKSMGKYHEDLENGEKIKKYISCLFPLLLESWIEVRPYFDRRENFTKKFVLSPEAALTLKIILDILECLWEMVDICDRKFATCFTLSDWFKQSYISEFTSQFLNNFPYQQFENKTTFNDKSRGTEILKNIEISGGLECFKQNMSLIHICNKFYSADIAKEKEISTKFLEYMKNITNQLEITMDYLKPFEKALRSILYTNAKYFINVNEIECKLLLNIVIKQYHNENFPKNFTPNIVALLCDIVLSEEKLSFGPNEYLSWLELLPLVLTKESVSQTVLTTLMELGKQKNEIFLRALGGNVEKILTNLDNLQVLDCNNILEGKMIILDMFYWIDYWDQKDQIQKFINNKELSNYFKFVVEKYSN